MQITRMPGSQIKLRLNGYARQGVVDAMPVAVSFLFVFSSLGALYHEKGVHFISALLGTLLIFAAPLQVSSVDAITNNHIVAGVILTLLINFRFLFMSLVSNQYFLNVSRLKVFIAMLMFSASTFAVTHAHLQSSRLKDGKSQFYYYLGVCVPSYVMAVAATISGYLLSDYVNYTSWETFITMILPIHFTALVAKNVGNRLTVIATLVGGICAPLLNGVDSLWFTVGLPVICGIVLARISLDVEKRGAA
ncbi:AzlC family ABC transporter permease [Pseudomonas chlororaphis]|uniref:AzlC family ABC transporter permease n=1 Tax=Pseudomonas chlororaphis TaxID=587753 RepID=UPI0015E05658|nr:AzlC family ABC transporter permease [Pseudomonas chlororaphis]QLL12576.1 AzlC family ABC transporter permease [Pseudomonas chlororaphis subsp. aurantiaca]